VPFDFVKPHIDALARGHGISIKILAAQGGISVFEMLLLLPPSDGTDVQTYRRNVCDLTLSQAVQRLQSELLAFHKRKEEEAEAAMLKAMEEGAT